MELSQHEEMAGGPAFTDEDLSTASAGRGAGPMDEEGRGGETKEDEDDLAGGDDDDEDEEDEEDEDEEDDEDIVQDLLGSQRSESSLGGTLNALMGRVQATDLTTSTLDALQQTENVSLPPSDHLLFQFLIDININISFFKIKYK